MSDLTERVARMLAEYVEHGSADQMVKGEGGDLVPFWTRQVPFARAAIREVLAEQEAWADNAEDPDFSRQGLLEFARKYGIEP